MKSLLEGFFRLTPLGRADSRIRAFLEMRLDDHQFERYNKALKKYRNFRIIQQIVRVFMYASLVTSVAASFNVNLSFISRLASYLGFSVLLIIYMFFYYFAMLYREEYEVQRDILITTAAEGRIKEEVEKDLEE